MFRALFWKEWRQLALVRWGGIALGAVLPVAFSAGAELARRGLLPTGSVTGYAPRDLMYEILPAALALGLWPLIGLMSAAQAFAGDRAAGTEAFLLERPVPRSRSWRARLLASFATLVAVVVATAALAAAAAAFTGAPPGVESSRWALLVSSGVAVGLLALLGGLIAASLLSSPLGAVLLGAMLAGVPVVLAAELSTIFSYARIGNMILGAVLPALLLPAYLVASWLAFCRGEPAGRGRVRRAVTFLGAVLAGVFVLFVVFAPVVVRASAAIGQHTVEPAPAGGKAFVTSGRYGGGGGWIVDVATGTKRSFVPPPLRELVWSPDGSEFAMVTAAGVWGSERSDWRIEIRSAADGRLTLSIPIADELVVADLAWAGKALVTVVSRRGPQKKPVVDVEVIDPVTGSWRPTGFRSESLWMSLTARLKDRGVFVRTIDREKPADNPVIPRGYRLHPIDVNAASVGPAISDAAGHEMTFAGWSGALSPSGRFARIAGDGDDGRDARIVDLHASAVGPASTSPSWALWISGDRLIWLDRLDHTTRLFLASPESPPKALREWRDGQVGLQPSPDRHAVFVSVLPLGGDPAADARRGSPDPALFAGSAPMGSIPEELVYLPDDDRFVSLGEPFSSRANDLRYTQWAGPNTLARIGLGVVGFEEVGAPATRRFVIGGPVK